jgi:hypothetical protein
VLALSIQVLILPSLSEGDLRIHDFIPTERLRVAGPNKFSCLYRPSPLMSLQIHHTVSGLVHPFQVRGIPH